jgi:hypothetical protein
MYNAIVLSCFRAVNVSRCLALRWLGPDQSTTAHRHEFHFCQGFLLSECRTDRPTFIETAVSVRQSLVFTGCSWECKEVMSSAVHLCGRLIAWFWEFDCYVGNLCRDHTSSLPPSLVLTYCNNKRILCFMYLHTVFGAELKNIWNGNTVFVNP